MAAGYIAGYSGELGDLIRDVVEKTEKDLLLLSPTVFVGLVASSCSATDANGDANAILGAQLAAFKRLASFRSGG